ncbi:MAG TPA: N-acetyltransferase [Gemmataceae bacterium]|nr:N-acetyltransferase [Gemmataceae bacterium]
MTVRPATTADVADALALLHGTGPTSEAVAHSFRLIARGELDPRNLLVARGAGRVVGAVFGQVLPGASAVVWPPRAIDSAIEDQLMAAVITHAAGAKVLQTFLPPEGMALAAPLLRAGFRHVTRVWQMHRPATALGVAPSLSLHPFTPADYPLLLRCHDDSDDCPELHGVRTPDEVVAGYLDAAPDPATWWVAVAGSAPVGTLILSGEEVCFLGVVPEHRGRGFGRALVDVLCTFAHPLSLIVDCRNERACRLYRAAGFSTVGAREVLLKF